MMLYNKYKNKIKIRTYILCGEIASFTQSGRPCVAGVCLSRLFWGRDAFFCDVFYKVRLYDLFLAGGIPLLKSNKFSKKTYLLYAVALYSRGFFRTLNLTFFHCIWYSLFKVGRRCLCQLRRFGPKFFIPENLLLSFALLRWSFS